jgi:hypothetical protein
VVELYILAKRPGNPHEKLNFKNERVQFEFQALLQADTIMHIFFVEASFQE